MSDKEPKEGKFAGWEKEIIACNICEWSVKFKYPTYWSYDEEYGWDTMEAYHEGTLPKGWLLGTIRDNEPMNWFGNYFFICRRCLKRVMKYAESI